MRSSPPSSKEKVAEVVDAGIGQRVTSALVDVVFFAIVGVLGWGGRLSEPTLAVLLGSYASFRFGVAQGKQQTQTVIALTRGDFGGGGTGGSGLMQAVRVAPPTASAVRDPRVDEPWNPNARLHEVRWATT